jgi:hypothetical protein
LSRKKKEQRKDDKLQKIYDEEPPMPKFFNERRSDPKPFKGENGAWYCGNESCKVENAELFNLGDGWHTCGHCYREFNL